MRDKPGNKIEDRLDMLTGANTPAAAKEGLGREASILSQPLDDQPGIIQLFLERFGNIGLLFEQADTNLTLLKLLMVSGVLAVLGGAMGIVVGVHPALLPVIGLVLAALPLLWLLMRRKRRLKAFAAQLPDALEMLS